VARYIVAVSGGVDSVVLLHKLVHEKKHQIVVAHFDHGIRSDSVADARFVKGLAEQYGLAFESRRAELGRHASEDTARTHRYEFLRDVAKQYKAQLVTAHHKDDTVETIAINMTRGTGWRGLAVMNSNDVLRPLLHLSKREVYDYALRKNLEWVEDKTNNTNLYLRNRLRKKIHTLSTRTTKQLVALRNAQLIVRDNIEAEEVSLQLVAPYSRYFFTHIDTVVAIELLRYIFDFSITHPQATRTLHGVKVAKAGSVIEVGGGQRLRFSLTEFIVETP